MREELLELQPKRYLCPYCGEWHDWDLSNELGYYDGTLYEAELGCERQLPNCEERKTAIYFSDGCCYYRTIPTCGRGNLYIDDGIPIKDIVESSEAPRVTFTHPFITEDLVDRWECSDCDDKDRCLICKLGDENQSRHMSITFGFEFEQSDYERIVKGDISARKEKELQEREQAINSKEQALKEREDATASREQALKKREDATASREQALEEREAAVASKEQVSQQSRVNENKEDTTMAETTKKTGIKSVLYEKSPKENLETLKVWAEKYKPTLKWVVPVVAVYGAYRILNSKEFDLSVNNIADTCEKKLGFKLELLENQKALKELMAIGGITATAYGAVKAVSGIFGAKEKTEDISVEEVEDEMNQLDAISKKFSFIQPKTEDMLPVAISVILVYVTLHKPNCDGKVASKIHLLTEDLQIRLGVYADMFKLFVQDKFNIDLNTAEGKDKMKICGFLIAVMGVLAFLYGKKVLGNKETSEEHEEETSMSIKSVIEQAKAIIKKIAPTAYTTLITMLVSKKILSLDEPLGTDENEPNSIDEMEES